MSDHFPDIERIIADRLRASFPDAPIYIPGEHEWIPLGYITKDPNGPILDGTPLPEVDCGPETGEAQGGGSDAR